MALGDNTLTVARGNSARGRQPYYVQGFVNFATAATDKGGALAAADVIPALTVPANHVILAAGLEVTADNLDVTIAAATTAPTGGEVRVWAVLMDIDDSGSMVADEVSRDLA